MHKQRKNIRLKNYDYSSDGWYFVTMVTKNRIHFFGEITKGKMNFTEIGKQAETFWKDIPGHFPQVELGEFVIMPDHIHGIIGIHSAVETCHGVPQAARKNEFGKTIPGSLAAIIGQFKSTLSRWCNKNNKSHFGWQSRFHDRIIRNQEEFDRIEKYIANNIDNWDL